MGKLSRRKGAAFECDVAKRLRPVFGPQVRRGIQTRGGGKEQPDINGLPDWLHIECHHGAETPWAKLRQAEYDAPSDEVLKAAVVRRNGGEELVAMRWDQWLAMVAIVHALAARMAEAES